MDLLYIDFTIYRFLYYIWIFVPINIDRSGSLYHYKKVFVPLNIDDINLIICTNTHTHTHTYTHTYTHTHTRLRENLEVYWHRR